MKRGMKEVGVEEEEKIDSSASDGDNVERRERVPSQLFPLRRRPFLSSHSYLCRSALAAP